MTCTHSSHEGRFPRLVFGLLVILVGVLLTLDNFYVIDIGDYWDYWPAIFILLGLAKLLQPPGCPGRGLGACLVLLGGWWLLYNLEVIDWSVWDAWPVLVVLLGISIVWRSLTAGRRSAGPASSDTSTVSIFAMLGGVDRRISATDFKGGTVTAILGACDLDLRQAQIAGDTAVIDLVAIWGGIDITIPDTWAVVVKTNPVLGAIEDKTAAPSGETTKTLIVKGTVLMGGVEIKN